MSSFIIEYYENMKVSNRIVHILKLQSDQFYSSHFIFFHNHISRMRCLTLLQQLIFKQDAGDK